MELNGLTLQPPVTYFCSDEGLKFETSAFKFVYGGQLTISTQLINSYLFFTSPATQWFFLNTNFILDGIIQIKKKRQRG